MRRTRLDYRPDRKGNADSALPSQAKVLEPHRHQQIVVEFFIPDVWLELAGSTGLVVFSSEAYDRAMGWNAASGMSEKSAERNTPSRLGALAILPVSGWWRAQNSRPRSSESGACTSMLFI